LRNCQIHYPLPNPLSCISTSYPDTYYGGLTRDWLYWYDENDRRYPTPTERVQRERQRADRLAAQLRALGIEPD
jgi:hypothetical protein